MKIFRDKKREEFLEKEIRDLVNALEKVKGDRDSFSFSARELKGQLDISEGKVLKANAEIQACYSSIEGMRKLVSEGAAYKADNLTLIARVAHLQEALTESLRQFAQQSEEYKDLQETVQKLLDAVEKAKARKKKAAAKKRKRK